MRLSVELSPKEPTWEIGLLAGLVERLGFDAVWLTEHFFNRSSVVAAAHLLSRLRRAEVGLGVLNPFVFHPAVIAQVAATLTEVGSGKVVLGIGAGDATTLEALGYRRERPVERVRECVRSVRALLSGEGLDDGVRLDFRPASDVRIYVAAQGPKMLELAGEEGDGVLINSTNLPFLEDSVRLVRSSAGRVGRTVAVEAGLMVSVHEDRAKALAAVKPYVAVVLTGSPTDYTARLGVEEDLVARVRELVKAGRWQEVRESLPDDVASSMALAGTAKDVRRAIEGLPFEDLDGLIIGGPLGPDPRRAIVELHRVLVERPLGRR
ncbi:MAG: LLM class flavin-dependent oxidoreductase [Nitrososphaerota archaeon]|nr:LLM class flavin-dependent oxidoreductase [Nitrososphaerota archaeon]